VDDFDAGVALDDVDHVAQYEHLLVLRHLGLEEVDLGVHADTQVDVVKHDLVDLQDEVPVRVVYHCGVEGIVRLWFVGVDHLDRVLHHKPIHRADGRTLRLAEVNRQVGTQLSEEQNFIGGWVGGSRIVMVEAGT
jgi:hypothetical protein